MSDIYFDLPRHNDKTFQPATYRAKVAALAAKYSAADITEAIAGYRLAIDRNHGIEFDDTRTRHKHGCAIAALEAALAAQETR